MRCFVPLCRFAFATCLSATLPGQLRGAGESSPTDEGPRQLQFGSITVYSENDKYFAGTDRNYTNGFKLSGLTTALTSFTDDPVPLPVQTVARAIQRLVPAGYDYKLGLALGQNIYTPANIDTTQFQPDDRPYAAWLYASSAFQIYRPPVPSGFGLGHVDRLDTIEVTLGMIGPGALGRQVQNNFHHAVGMEPARGWRHQLRNEPGLVVAYERKVRASAGGNEYGWGGDLIAHGGVSLGNIFTYANLGAEMRGGWRLPADFGTNLIRPSGDSGPGERPAWNAFAFAAFDVRAIGRDVTLEGNTFRSSHAVKPERFVLDLLTGFAIGIRHWQFTYSQAVRTREFVGQTRRSVFGSVSVTFFY